MADVKTRAYYAPYDNDYYIPDAEGEKRVGKNENWRDIEKGFYQVQAKNDEQDGQFAEIEAKDEEQDGRLDAIEAKDVEQDGRLDAIEAVNTQQNLDIQTNRTNITGLDTRLTSAESLLDVVSQTSVENSAAIAQLQTDQQTLSGRLDTTNAQVADNSTRLTRAENNITSNTQELQLQGAQISVLEDQAVIRLQATFDRQTETVTLTDPAAAYDALTAGNNAVIDLLIDNSFASIYTKDIDNSTNNTYRFTHAETGVDAGGHGYTGLDAITITLDPVTETVSNVAWSNVYNVSEEKVLDLIHNNRDIYVRPAIPTQSPSTIDRGMYTLTCDVTNLRPLANYMILAASCNHISVGGADIIPGVYPDNYTTAVSTDSQGKFTKPIMVDFRDARGAVSGSFIGPIFLTLLEVQS